VAGDAPVARPGKGRPKRNLLEVGAKAMEALHDGDANSEFDGDGKTQQKEFSKRLKIYLKNKLDVTKDGDKLNPLNDMRRRVSAAHDLLAVANSKGIHHSEFRSTYETYADTLAADPSAWDDYPTFWKVAYRELIIQDSIAASEFWTKLSHTDLVGIGLPVSDVAGKQRELVCTKIVSLKKI